MLHIRLGKQLDQFALRVDVSLGARVTGLFGPSGSGKTTLLNCLAGLIRPDDGQFRVDETCFFDSEQSTHIPCRHREIGYVFQDGLLFDHMTVRQNLNFSRHTRSGPNLEQVVDVLELDHLIDRGASNLSGGEARRVALGRAILSAPRLLLLDEPLTGLDRRMSGKTLAYIRNVLDAFEIPTVYVSHSISDIVYLCDEVVVLDRGGVVGQGSPSELLGTMVETDHGHQPALKNVFSLEVKADSAVEGTTRCDMDDQELVIGAETPPGMNHITAMVYARDIILANDRPRSLSARNILKGRVTRIESFGSRSVVSVDVGEIWMVEVTPLAVSELDLKVASEVCVIVKASAIQSLGFDNGVRMVQR